MKFSETVMLGGSCLSAGVVLNGKSDVTVLERGATIGGEYFDTCCPVAPMEQEVRYEPVRQLQEALQIAREANESKTTFLSNMSHDIRTPMNAIIGFSELLEKHIDEKDKAIAYLGKIKSSSEYLLSLLNDVLEMARIESGKYIMDETVTDIREFDRSICDVFENQLEQKGICFVFL